MKFEKFCWDKEGWGGGCDDTNICFGSGGLDLNFSLIAVILKLCVDESDSFFGSRIHALIFISLSGLVFSSINLQNLCYLNPQASGSLNMLNI